MSDNYGLDVKCDKVSLYGVSGVRINGLSIVPRGCDTLLLVGMVDVRVSLWKLLFGRVSVRRVTVRDGLVNMVKYDSLSNYVMFFKHNKTSDVESKNLPKRDFGHDCDRVVGLLFDLLPSNASIYNCGLRYSDREYSLSIVADTLMVRRGDFMSCVDIVEDGVSRRWTGEGVIGNSASGVQFRLYSGDSIRSMKVPYLKHKYGAEVVFDTLKVELSKARSGGVTTLIGSSFVSGLAVNHWRLSAEDIVLDRGQFDYKLHVGERFAEIDSSSTVRINRIECNPYLRVEKDSCWRVSASLNKQNFPADDLFGSLPKGLFRNLEGIKTTGALSYHFLFEVDMANVDSLRLESVLKRCDDFKLLGFGHSNLRKMNEPFTYTAYEKGEPVRSFVVGDENPSFRPLVSIPDVLKMSVLQSEDGQFFYHNGFLMDCIRSALIEDIRQGRFVRGGSTISMQLIKNVFLNRNKNIARKIEEALIVWFIEGQRLTSKERMFEVYLNIAEWGPMVYGIAEASRFYFDKEPSELTVNESIFLASLIPRPKTSLYFFDENGQLKEFYESYFTLIAERLVEKGVISEDEALNVRAEVELRGEAKRRLDERLRKIETVGADSTLVVAELVVPEIDLPAEL